MNDCEHCAGIIFAQTHIRCSEVTFSRHSLNEVQVLTAKHNTALKLLLPQTLSRDLEVAFLNAVPFGNVPT